MHPTEQWQTPTLYMKIIRLHIQHFAYSLSPWSKKDGWDCSYYRDIPYDALPCKQISLLDYIYIYY